MSFALKSLSVSCLDVPAAADFYRNIFSAPSTTDGESIATDLHGTGRLELVPAQPAEPSAASGTAYQRAVLTYIRPGPGDVRTMTDAAATHGADIFKPARKALFGAFSGSFMAPEGTVWKLAAAGKDTASLEGAARPTETTVTLGVREPKVSKAFYAALGMSVDRDYGNKYIDFLPADGASWLCLMQEPVLAKDVAASDPHVGTSSVTLRHQSASHAEAERIVSAALAGGCAQTGQGNSLDPGSATISDPGGPPLDHLGPATLSRGKVATRLPNTRITWQRKSTSRRRLEATGRSAVTSESWTCPR
ncbi:VOC family protein [Paeniglutamicibacter gangotriensis]|uniref:Glyoxalase-like domain protein n=1 Tax=Paeniglutamicibacter gangotriensis Lz1y TaxID=1276920 RepID=M7NBM1_9MICC|nr:hypothetical protein [Paeniglutamicibacter gangotriensis]EMQ99194.1 Glyoxalase-like domain protein [Paeniglutamicibacter gangotriensis Lz1y]